MRFFNCAATLGLYALLFAACQSSTTTGCDSAASSGTTGCPSSQCAGTLRDCKNGAADGCETDTAIDSENCGGCGVKCPTPANGEAACSAGVCGVSACGTRYKDCNASATDGCEIDTSRDANNCGACGNVCAGGANAAGVCIQGKCQLACQAAYLDCNNDPSDGCETNGASDLSNCGNCGNTCAAVGATNAACSAGSCISTMCNTAYQTCKAGPIDSCETNTATSLSNCGACGKQCDAVANGMPGCTASNCGIASCNAGYADCDKTLANGCEINTSNDVKNCNTCGTACPSLANASTACAASACVLASCNAGYGDCDKNIANGCEVNTNSDINNCGMCGKACAPGAHCSSGTCVTCTDNEVAFNGHCYYLDGSTGTCDPNYSLAPESILTQIAAQFPGKTYKHTVSGNCCIWTSDALENYGMNEHCNSAGPFAADEPTPGGASCIAQMNHFSGQLTFCGSN